MAISPPQPRLIVPAPALAAMLAQAVNEAPNECCGLLGGYFDDEGWPVRATIVYPLENAAASPVEFESEPRSLFAAMREIRFRGEEVVAIYHSHPNSDAIPSRKDLERSWSDRVVNLIISLQSGQPEVRGWWLSPDQYTPAEWVVG